MKASRLHAQAYAPPLVPPATLTRTAAAGMSEAKRREYAREVRRYLNGHYFDSERDRHIRQVLNDLIEDNAEMLWSVPAFLDLELGCDFLQGSVATLKFVRS